MTLELEPPDVALAADDHIDFARTFADFRALVRADRAANPHNPFSRTLLFGFRFAQWSMGTPERMRLRAVLPVAAYRFWTEWIVGIELRPKTRVGGGLAIFHGYAMVVNDHARIGRGVSLRNGVTIGHREDGGRCPVLRDGVAVGAGAIILGDIEIGAGAKIGAGAVVLTSVPAGRTAVGNPARVLPESA
jgi:putative colanic acid biosynthesis acetyltransferase WcaB